MNQPYSYVRIPSSIGKNGVWTKFELAFTCRKYRFSPVETLGMQETGFEYTFTGKK